MSKGQSGKSEAVRTVRLQRPHWRFEDLQIWNNACELAVDFHRIANGLDRRRLYRYAEQLRAAGLSLPNNIAEGPVVRINRNLFNFLTSRVDLCLKTRRCSSCLKGFSC